MSQLRQALQLSSAYIALGTFLVCILLYTMSPHISFVSQAIESWRGMTHIDISSSSFWALVLPSVLFHSSVTHLFSNMALFVPFCAAVEAEFGHIPAAALVISSGILSSAIQLLLSGHGDIGASGIVFALFGVLLVVRLHVPSFRVVLPNVLAIGLCLWFLYCIFATGVGSAYYGNFSHTTGLVFGLFVGILFLAPVRRRAKKA